MTDLPSDAAARDLDDDAVAWLPVGDGRWARTSLLTFDADGGRIAAVGLSDDPDALGRAVTDGSAGDELDEEQDSSEWDRAEDSGWGWEESQSTDR